MIWYCRDFKSFYHILFNIFDALLYIGLGTVGGGAEHLNILSGGWSIFEPPKILYPFIKLD